MEVILLELSFIMDKRKEGVALFITLTVIASIMTIIAVSFTYLDRVRKEAGEASAIIQGNLLFKNSLDVLKRFFPAKGDNSKKLEIIYTLPLILDEPKNGFNLTLTCSPLMVGVPINWLDEEITSDVPEKSSLAKEVLMAVMELYEIEDPNSLEKLIFNSVKGVALDDAEYSSRVKPQKGIVSKKQFDNLMTNYFLRHGDAKVLSVPWDKYFTFLKVDKTTQIDGVYMSPQFISAAFDMPLELVQDEWIVGESKLSSFLSENGIIASINKKIYSKKALNAMHCEELYLYQGRQYQFNFNYIKERSSNFEFNRQK